jgi:hypothetical protein
VRLALGKVGISHLAEATLWTMSTRMTWDRCYDFLNIFVEKFSKKLAFLTQNKAKLCKSLIITLVFEKNAIFFRRKLSKIAENCVHNIDPRLCEFSPIELFFTLGSGLKMTGVAQILGLFFPTVPAVS